MEFIPRSRITVYLNLLYLALLLTFSGCHTDNVKINNTIWGSRNLDVSVYQNGDSIPHVQDSAAWMNLTTGAWCYYENNDSFGKISGKLYNWYAVNDARGLCPEGWHISSEADWEEAVNVLGGADTAAAKMKSKDHWRAPKANADNSSGFSALPGGNRKETGFFNGYGNSGVYWTSAEEDKQTAIARYMNRAHSRVGRRAGDKRNALSCRCVKNNSSGF